MMYAVHIQLPKPKTKPLIGHLSVGLGIAHVFSDNDALLAVLNHPEVVFLNQDGIKLKGYEPVGFEKNGQEKFRYQEWWCRYVPERKP